MSYWLHSLIGLALAAIALVAVVHAQQMQRLRDANAQRYSAETDRERAARRIC